jgi:GNAT superfamily N-acetyltransferase
MARDVRVSWDIRLEVDRLDSPIGRVLIDELMDDLAARYGFPDPEAPPADALAPPDGIFFVAWRGDEALGCGGLRRFADGVGEIKRMFVRAAARRAGVARMLLAAVEDHARQVGYQRLILETGEKQPEAIALYRANGYAAIDSYGPYADWPSSRCFAKDLA